VAPTARTLLCGWLVYLTGAASMAMPAIAELVLPALLEDRHISVSWSGPLLAGRAGRRYRRALLWPADLARLRYEPRAWRSSPPPPAVSV
jgi:hypothetical protein